MKLILIVLCCITLAGCMPKRDLSREDWLQMSTKTFPDTNVEQIYKTAEKVLKASDPTDVLISHTEDKMLGQRNFLIYAVLAATVGQYDFDITARQDGKSVVMKMDIYRQLQGAFGPSMRHPFQWREAYDAYFGRMEALLYGKPWMICEELEEAAESNATLEPLCLLADDNIPDGVKLSDRSAKIVAERKDAEKNSR